MHNILYVSNEYSRKSYGGRQNLSYLLTKILKKIFKKNFFNYKLKLKSNKSIAELIINTFKGNIDGVDKNSINKIINIIKKNNISHVFVEGSNLGSLCKYIKLYNIRIKIFVFFHNVESKFFFDSFLINKTFHSFGVLLANYIAEKNSCAYSDKSIALTQNDKNLIYKIYKKRINYIVPLFVKDIRNNNKFGKTKFNNKFILFVGSAFYANLAGISWFVKKVLPRINFNLAIIGNNFENYKHLFNHKKIIFLGKVKNLNYWYENSSFIISPIFSGSGMKSKVAEAMMFGKKILGTKKSFIGYEIVKKKIGFECNDKKTFIKKIKKMNNNKNFVPEIRKLYKKHYSFEASLNKMKTIMKKN